MQSLARRSRRWLDACSCETAIEKRNLMMDDFVLFYMDDWTRAGLINGHKFYVEQAKQRLLSQFDDIDGEANLFGEKWLSDHAHLYNPENLSSRYSEEAAGDAMNTFHQLLTEMHVSTRLSVVTGMFHEWEKQVRNWLTSGLKQYPRGEMEDDIWKNDFDKLFNFLEWLKCASREDKYYTHLDMCRLVVNVYKHGYGSSFKNLKNKYPDLIVWPKANRQTGWLEHVVFRRKHILSF
jgi:hypothetical protein